MGPLISAPRFTPTQLREEKKMGIHRTGDRRREEPPRWHHFAVAASACRLVRAQRFFRAYHPPQSIPQFECFDQRMMIRPNVSYFLFLILRQFVIIEDEIYLLFQLSELHRMYREAELVIVFV